MLFGSLTLLEGKSVDDAKERIQVSFFQSSVASVSHTNAPRPCIHLQAYVPTLIR